MEKFFIIGGNTLNGEVKIDSAKNALLPIIAACILVEGEVMLEDVPKYSDVLAMCKILENLGGKTCWRDNSLVINCKNLDKNEVPNHLSSPIRSSIFTLGAILGRMKKAKVSYPGGCDIGLRPIDIHINGLKTLGVNIVEKNGYIYADGTKAKSTTFTLPFASVGATENLIMLACLTKGTTKIINPAKEPEIEDLQNFLNKCGACIKGAGTSEIVIEGVKKLKGTTFKAIPDRIETGTFLIATAMTKGKVLLKNTLPSHNKILIDLLCKSGSKIKIYKNEILIESKTRSNSFGEIETAVYPGFSTDLQPQLMALASMSNGCSVICENLFEARFKHVSELKKMGAQIKCKNGIAIITGKEKLYGADVTSTDLRGGASLVLAGLSAEGYTTIDKIELVDRGYYKIEEKLSALGGIVKRI